LRGDLQAQGLRRDVRCYERGVARWDIGRPVDDAVGWCDDAYVLMQSVESPKFNESRRPRAPELCRVDALPRHANGIRGRRPNALTLPLS
jgi:hypothetical protein